MKQEIPTSIGATVLIAVAIITSALVWYYDKSQQNLIQKPIQTHLETQKNNQQSSIDDSLSKLDTVLINRSNGIYEINLTTKELKPYDNPLTNLSNFSGLPEETKNEQVSVINSTRLVSQNKTKAIIISVTYDATAEPSGFDGSLPILKASEFTCDTITKKCSPTDYLESAYKATGLYGNWYGYTSIWWFNWDSAKNILYGHLTGEGVGNASPAYTLDLNTKTLKQTIGYNSFNEKEKRAEVPSGAFSPSLSKLVMIDENWGRDNSESKWDLLLYDISDLSKPLKKIDISSIKDEGYRSDRVHSVAWSADERTLILETQKQIHTLNLESGKTNLIYTDTTKDPVGLWLDFNAVRLSQSGRYIVFVDYDKRSNSSRGNKLNTVLKAIDLDNNNNIIELLREESITLNHRF